MKRRKKKREILVPESHADELREHADTIATIVARLRVLEGVLYAAKQQAWEDAVEKYGEERVALHGRTRQNAAARRLSDAHESLEVAIFSSADNISTALRAAARRLYP